MVSGNSPADWSWGVWFPVGSDMSTLSATTKTWKLPSTNPRASAVITQSSIGLYLHDHVLPLMSKVPVTFAYAFHMQICYGSWHNYYF